jgi:hypothetical protein
MLFALLAGCGGPGSVPVEQPDTSAVDAVRRELQMVKDSGALGSEMISIQDNLEKMKATDAATAEALLADLQELESMSDEAQVRAKVDEMLGKLPGGA